MLYISISINLILLKVMEDPCKNCTIKGKIITGVGPLNAKIVLIGEAPGEEENKLGEPFVGKSGQLLNRALEQAGLPRSWIRIQNAVPCRPPNNRTPTNQEIDNCRPNLDAILKQIKPLVVIPTGNAALYYTEHIDAGILTRSGIPKKMQDYWSIPAIHPSWFIRQGGKDISKLVDALKVAKSFAYGEEDLDVCYTLLNNRELLTEWLEMIYDSDTKVMALDIETRDLELNTPVLGIGFGYRKGGSVYIPFMAGSMMARKSTSDMKSSVKLSEFWKGAQKDVEGEVVKLINSGKFKFVTHNGPFDLSRLIVNKGREFSFAKNWEFDTFAGHYLLDENKGKQDAALGVVLKRYSDLGDYKAETKSASDFGTHSIEAIAMRCMKDCDGTLREYYRLRPLIVEQDLSYMLFSYMLNTHKLLAEMEVNGIYIDKVAMDKLNARLTSQLENLDKAIIKLAGGVFNPASGDQLADVLFNKFKVGTPVTFTDGGKDGKSSRPSVEGEHLKLFVGKHPIVQLALDRVDVAKMKNTYVDGWGEKILDDGRIHTNYNCAYGTTGGRISSSKPNMQNPDRRADVRNMISAPPGWCIVGTDISQAEIRWLAHESRDKNLIQAFMDDRDIHCYNVAKCYNIPYNDVVTRYKEKDPEIVKMRKYMKETVSFGALYGMGDEGLGLRIQEPNESIQKAIARARELKTIWTKEFPGVERRRRDVHEFLKANGWIRSAYGQIRRLPGAVSGNEAEKAFALRQGFNFIIQTPAAQMTLIYMYKIWERLCGFKIDDGCKPTMNIHDMMGFETRYDCILQLIDTINLAILEKPHPDMEVPILHDLSIDKPWEIPLVVHIGEQGKPICGVKTEDTCVFSIADAIHTPDRNNCKHCLERLAA